MLSSAINNKNSVDTSAKHGSYSVKVHSEKYSTWYIQYQFADAKIAWLTWWCSSRFLRFCTVHIVKSDIYFYLITLQALISVVKSTWLASKICWRRVTRRVNFFMDNFDLVLSNKLTNTLSSGPLYTSMW